jgi:regulator of protease activity HflC (stomatin/prohibitin superfamily)
MKKIFIITLLIASFMACSKVPAGNVGIKVYLLGNDKGVDSEELGVGRYYIGINQELYLFPTFQQNYVWTANRTEGSETDESFTFQTAEGLGCNADVGISYHLNPEKINTIFQKYRKGIEEITDIFLRNQVRDAFNSVAGKYKVESVYGKGKVKLIQEVQELVSSQVSNQGIMIDKIYWIGTIRLPEQVVGRINSKIAATQKAEQAENELREAEAEAQKAIAIAKGEAKANQVRLSSITPQMIAYEEMLTRRKALEKWNGVLPQTILPDSAIPFIGKQ